MNTRLTRTLKPQVKAASNNWCSPYCNNNNKTFSSWWRWWWSCLYRWGSDSKQQDAETSTPSVNEWVLLKYTYVSWYLYQQSAISACLLRLGLVLSFAAANLALAFVIFLTTVLLTPLFRSLDHRVVAVSRVLLELIFVRNGLLGLSFDFIDINSVIKFSLYFVYDSIINI